AAQPRWRTASIPRPMPRPTRGRGRAAPSLRPRAGALEEVGCLGLEAELLGVLAAGERVQYLGHRALHELGARILARELLERREALVGERGAGIGAQYREHVGEHLLRRRRALRDRTPDDVTHRGAPRQRKQAEQGRERHEPQPERARERMWATVVGGRR